MAVHNDLGKAGEELAAGFLVMHGMSLLHTNWRAGRDEIDLILRHGRILVFVEVKTRSADAFEQPEDAIDPKKRSGLLRAAGKFVEQSGHDGPVRFDVVSVVEWPHGRKIYYMPDAFFPIGG